MGTPFSLSTSRRPVLCPGHYTPGQSHWYALSRRVGGPQS